MIALSASTLVNAGPEPLDLFGVSDWREGCPTLRRHDHGNSPVRPMTVDAPLPPAPQIGPFVGQMQHTNDIYYGLLRRHLFGHPLSEPGAGVAASLSNAAGIFRGDVARLLGLTARIISKTSLIQV